MKFILFIIILSLSLLQFGTAQGNVRKKINSDSSKLLPPHWNPQSAADKVLFRLVNVSAPYVKGTHDAEFVCVGNRAFIVAEANNVKSGENASWPFIYTTLSVVNLKTLKVENIIPMAKGEQFFENETLPAGACFVPRIIQKDNQTLRCFFASEDPGKRESQTWYIDFSIPQMAFEDRIHRAKLKTYEGTFNMQPKYFYNDAKIQGFNHPPLDFGLYIVDSFKSFDGKTYVGINNYPAGQNALAVLNDSMDVFEVIGHYNEPSELRLTESAVNRLPDGTWMAICRQEGGNANYVFTTSVDGKIWTKGASHDIILNGTSSKPVFEKFRGVYYLGWQESTKINNVGRSVYNIDISLDGKVWERKYHFETTLSFQYPSLHEHNGSIWLSVTSDGQKKIMFGKLEEFK